MYIYIYIYIYVHYTYIYIYIFVKYAKYLRDIDQINKKLQNIKQLPIYRLSEIILLHA